MRYCINHFSYYSENVAFFQFFSTMAAQLIFFFFAALFHYSVAIFCVSFFSPNDHESNY